MLASDPQRKLDSLLDEIDQPLAEANVEAHAGIGSDIFGDDRHHVTAPERGREADLQRACRLRRYRVGARSRRIEVAENFSRKLIDAVRFRRGSELACRPEEKLRSELALKKSDALADGRLTDAQLGCRRRKASPFQRPNKCTQAIDPVHRHSPWE